MQVHIGQNLIYPNIAMCSDLETQLLWEYDTENLTEKSNYTERPMKSFTKDNHIVYFLLITLKLSAIVTQEC